MRSVSRRSVVILTLAVCSIVIVALIVRAGVLTYQAGVAVKDGDLEAASSAGQQALPTVTVVSNLTLQQIPDIELWRLGLQLLAESPTIKSELTHNLLSPTDEKNQNTFKKMVNQGITLGQLYEKTWLIRRVTKAHQAKISQLTLDAKVLRETLLTGQHNIIVVFQNTHELRATGGFTGSYALIQLSDGQLINLEIFDIYQPDGQFIGYVTAPTGVAEYLSSGRGLRLPDANWWPDFPASAQQMLAFFALGKTNTIDGVVAVNLDLVEELLDVTGPIYIPDYQVEVTSHNVADVLRSNRDEFFPGSVAKQHLLSSFVRLFKLKLAETTPAQQRDILQRLLQKLPTKELQFFSAQSELQTWLESHHIAGQQQTHLPDQTGDTSLYFFPVESNVGINKANRNIQRSIDLNLGQTASSLQVTFQNQTHPPLAYVNYQRVFVLPSTKVERITYQGQPLPTWHEEIITTSTGEQVKQIGFLLTLLPGQTGLTTIQLSHPPLPSPATVVWQKQSGVPPYTLSVTNQGTKQTYYIDRDQWFSWQLNP